MHARAAVLCAAAAATPAAARRAFVGVGIDIATGYNPAGGAPADVPLAWREYDPLTGKVTRRAVNGTVACPANCTAPLGDGGEDNARHAYVPAAESPLGVATVYFTFACVCQRRDGHTVQSYWAPPTVGSIDLSRRVAAKVADAPAALFNSGAQSFATLAWAPGSGGGGGRLILSDWRLTGGRNMTMAFAAVDAAAGTVTHLYDGPTYCAACAETLYPQRSLELEFGGRLVRQWARLARQNGNLAGQFPMRVMGMDDTTGAVTLDAAAPMDWVSWARSPAGVVGVAGCCVADQGAWCPAGCGDDLGRMAFVRWSEPTANQTLLASYSRDEQHDRGVLRWTSIGAVDDAGVYAAVLMRLPISVGAAPPDCHAAPGDQNRSTCGVGPGGPPNASACSAVAGAQCCWDEVNNWCWQHGTAPGDGQPRWALASFDTATGKWLHTKDLMDPSGPARAGGFCVGECATPLFFTALSGLPDDE